jgi:hypothetical protein
LGYAINDDLKWDYKEELLNTLKIRLAKREIISEEFEKLKKILDL